MLRAFWPADSLCALDGLTQPPNAVYPLINLDG